jgi:hypothetical protein
VSQILTTDSLLDASKTQFEADPRSRSVLLTPDIRAGSPRSKIPWGCGRLEDIGWDSECRWEQSDRESSGTDSEGAAFN